MSTNKECARRKSAPSSGCETSAMVNIHLKRQELKLSGIVWTPYVLMLLPLAAVRGGQFLLERVSVLDGGKTLTSAPVSTRKRRSE
ncbi:hypothetical protein Pcinc_005110 [Petrolisthes cinctipes]|uniref:Uncharacterized protein n=1 Tax=Petrolisthes cinctipes TaxID=88211 RepID=A0AAE1GK22_PETCI|nr:hypothetical protein Pcinc_005110 [Petrolisthes cinctipes]